MVSYFCLKFFLHIPQTKNTLYPQLGESPSIKEKENDQSKQAYVIWIMIIEKIKKWKEKETLVL